MTLLTVVQNACAMAGLPRPTAVISATDPTMRAILAHANMEGQALARDYEWQRLRSEQTFTTTATAEQTNAIPTDFNKFIDGTFWNRSRKMQLFGPLDPVIWQGFQAMTAAPVMDAFTYRGNSIYVNPVPAAGQTMSFEYISTYWCQSAAAAGQTAWVADTDTGRLSEALMTQGIVWRYKAARGLDIATDYSLYESMLRNLLQNDKPHAIMDFGGSPWVRVPMIGVPPGGWVL